MGSVPTCMMWRQRMHSLHAPWMAWWLAMALVLAPAMGRMHEVLHAPLSNAQMAPTTASTAHSAHPSASGIAAWFADHSALDCQLLDHLSQAHSHALGWLEMDLQLPNAGAQWHSIVLRGSTVQRMFLARAPPDSFMA